MKSKAAIAWPGADVWSVEEFELDSPGPGEVLVRLVGAGLCHSDSHLLHGGYPAMRRPVIGGHEGAGVVEAVGPGTTLAKAGDHVVFGFMPSCGTCHSCVHGMPHMCEVGQHYGRGFQVGDHTARHHARGEDLSLMSHLGAFAAHTVLHERSCIVVDPALPLDRLCVLGCAGMTGWGAAVNTAGVRPGDTTVVVGIGGIGAMAVQGARYAGAQQVVAVDPVALKRELATNFGATDACPSMADAEPMLRDATHGRMANQVIMCMGNGDGALLAQALALVGKRGRVVIVNVHPDGETTATVSLRNMQSYEKQVVGCLGGSWGPRLGVTTLTDLYARGLLNLDDMVTNRYNLDDINTGYDDQDAGKNIRGVVTEF